MNETVPLKPDWALTRRDRARLAEVASVAPRRWWPWVALAAVVVVLVGGYAATHRPHTTTEAPLSAADTVMQLNPEELTTVAPQTLQQTVAVTGSLAPAQQAQLTSQVAGRVEAVNVRPGDAVRKGDVLVQIDVESLRNQVNQQSDTASATRAQLALAQTQLDRTRSLAAKGVVPTSDLDQAQSNVDALQANLNALERQVATAQLTLQNATIVAPFDGMISSRAVDPGQSIAAGAALAEIVNLGTMVAETTAPVGDSARIVKGQTVTMTVEGIPGRKLVGTVDRINPVAIQGTRTVPVYVTLDNKDGILRGGMFVSGEIVVEERTAALAVPLRAVAKDDGGSYVLKIDADRVVRQPVTVGQNWAAGRLVDVTSGLSAGDVVVSVPLPQLQPDSRIQLVEN